MRQFPLKYIAIPLVVLLLIFAVLLYAFRSLYTSTQSALDTMAVEQQPAAVVVEDSSAQMSAELHTTDEAVSCEAYAEQCEPVPAPDIQEAAIPAADDKVGKTGTSTTVETSIIAENVTVQDATGVAADLAEADESEASAGITVEQAEIVSAQAAESDEVMADEVVTEEVVVEEETTDEVMVEEETTDEAMAEDGEDADSVAAAEEARAAAEAATAAGAATAEETVAVEVSTEPLIAVTEEEAEDAEAEAADADAEATDEVVADEESAEPQTTSVRDLSENRSLNTPVTVYKNTISRGWEDRSWDANVNFNGFPAYDGLTAMTVNFTAPDGAVYLYTPQAIRGYDYTVLRFYINGGINGGQLLSVALVDGDENVLKSVRISPPYPENWRQVDVSIEDLGDPELIRGIIFQDAAGEAQPVFFVDEVAFVDDPGALLYDENLVDGPSLAIYADKDLHDISPLIYGMNFAPEIVAKELALPINRWGGNAVTRYNYLEDASNTGANWFFENFPPEDPAPNLPRGSSADKFVQQNLRTETETLMTLPMIGWVARADYSCGFSTEIYGDQIETDKWRPECGAGVLVDGTVVLSGNPSDTSIEAPPSFIQGWMRHLISEFGTASEDGVRFYNLDNEPMIWSQTHRDIRPEQMGTDEFVNLTKMFAAAAKEVDPTANIVAPGFWGWSNYWWSDMDITPENDPKISAPDREAHGGDPLVVTYLKEMAAYEADTGVRILDYFDLHFYPQAIGVAFSEVGGESVQALRLRSTRALWDAAYVDESWIDEPVNLVPRMHDWVDTYYPGTKIAISEYNWGGLEHINGALAQADVLGIFGREAVDMATLWGPPETDQPGMYAFRMYRNYDTKGGRFGDVSLAATTENPDQIAIFAARRAADGVVTVIVINKSAVPFTSEITTTGLDSAKGSVPTYRYSNANLRAIERIGDLEYEGGDFTASFPPNSITLYTFGATE